MKLPPALHRWSLTPKEAVRLQARLAAKVRPIRLGRELRLIAGGDAAFLEGDSRIVAGWVVWNMASRCVVDSSVVVRPVRFPYVPGLLSFREAPALLAAARRLRIAPDVFVIDGHGLAHPRRFGIACHLGLLLDCPSLGCAKSRLCGRNIEPGPARGSTTQLRAEAKDQRGISAATRGEVIGAVVRTRAGTKPVYVSIGHRVTLEDAVKVVLSCGAGYRLPEPARLAHQLVTREKRRIESS